MYLCPMNRVIPQEIPNYVCAASEYFTLRNFPAPRPITRSMVDLSNTLRMLWEQHGAWTRMTIMSLVFGLTDTDLTVKRLLQSPVDFGNVLRLYYGDKNASKLTKLFTDHLTIAAALVKASKAGNKKAAEENEKKWYANADEIALLLSSMNPYWSKDEWTKMLHEHLDLVKAEAVDMLTKNYGAGVNIYDQIEKQALGMADVMTQGIINQFPNRFVQ